MINFKRLKDMREDHDLSQKDMAKILKVSRSAYSLWELGINIIPLNHLCDFADYFNSTIDYVLNLTNDKNHKHIKKGLNLKTLGNNLKNIRIKNKLSQENIAQILDITQACVARYEQGLICISTEKLYKFASEFNLSLSVICGKTK